MNLPEINPLVDPKKQESMIPVKNDEENKSEDILVNMDNMQEEDYPKIENNQQP